MLSSFSHVQLFAMLWTVAHQAPLSIGFSRQEFWSGLPFPSPEDLPDPGIEPASPALQMDSLLSKPQQSWISGYLGQHFCRNQMMFCELWLSFLGRARDVKVTQSCLTLCNPMDYTVHGILHARILEGVAFPVSRGSSQPRG